jgi:IS5 family transposase
MGQLGFFDTDKRLETLSAKGDPLEAIDRLVPWESFCAEVEAVVLTADELKKSSAGRKPFDALLMFKMLVLQALNKGRRVDKRQPAWWKITLENRHHLH